MRNYVQTVLGLVTCVLCLICLFVDVSVSNAAVVSESEMGKALGGSWDADGKCVTQQNGCLNWDTVCGGLSASECGAHVLTPVECESGCTESPTISTCQASGGNGCNDPSQPFTDSCGTGNAGECGSVTGGGCICWTGNGGGGSCGDFTTDDCHFP